MKLRMCEDECLTFFIAPEEDRLAGPVIVELSQREYSHYRRVQAAHEAWQRRLAEMWAKARSTSVKL
jgi:hypothetical protein